MDPAGGDFVADVSVFFPAVAADAAKYAESPSDRWTFVILGGFIMEAICCSLCLTGERGAWLDFLPGFS